MSNKRNEYLSNGEDVALDESSLPMIPTAAVVEVDSFTVTRNFSLVSKPRFVELSSKALRHFNGGRNCESMFHYPIKNETASAKTQRYKLI